MSVGIWALIRAKLSAFVAPLISRTQSTARVRVLAKPSNKLPVGMSARRLNALASEMRVCENYLEVGVAQGLTLEQIKAKLADTAIKERGKKELFAAEQRLKLVAGSGI